MIPGRVLEQQLIFIYCEIESGRIPLVPKFSSSNNKGYTGNIIMDPETGVLCHKPRAEMTKLLLYATSGTSEPGTIPLGVHFRPYPGKFLRAEDREEAEKSGKAWEISDPSGSRLLGFIDPSKVESSSTSQWMSKVNCSSTVAQQNLAGFQYLGRIYYCVVQPVPAGTELMVWYGDSYTRELGI